MLNRKWKYLLFLKELSLILILIVVYNNFLSKNNVRKGEVFIQADGRGYYEYLPALLIYKDIHLHYLDTLQTEYYTPEQNKLVGGGLIKDGHHKNKFFIGTAVLQAPFFLASHIVASGKTSTSPPDGFSYPYQRGIWFAAIFYLFAGMVVLRKLLETYEINQWWIYFIQLATIFATPLLFYTLYDSAYSHVYSFFLISCFLYLVRNYFLFGKRKYILWAMVVLGFTVIVRPVNILVLIFTPLLADSFREYLSRLKTLFAQHLRFFLSGCLLFGMVLSIQLVISYMQTGSPFSYNYGTERFFFSDPHFSDFLFSYQKGFFLWTPWWFVVFVSAFICWLANAAYYKLISFFLAFSLLIYVLSSWHAWSYGGSLGQRPMIDFYSAFILAFVPLIKEPRKIWKGILLLAVLPAITVMQIQTFQYKKAIILWDGMTKEQYWKVFLSTNEKYGWYFWKEPFPVGTLRHKTMLAGELSPSLYPGYLDTAILIKKGVIDSLSVFGEIRFQLDREADNEFMEIYLRDEKDSVQYYTLQRFFYNNERLVNVVYKFELPENKMDIIKFQLLIQNVRQPLKIKEVCFSTYNSLN